MSSPAPIDSDIKGKISVVCNVLAILLAFVNEFIADALYDERFRN